MAVVYAMSSGLAQDFTAERGKLLRAVDQIPPGQATFTFGWEDVPPTGRSFLVRFRVLTRICPYWVRPCERCKASRTR